MQRGYPVLVLPAMGGISALGYTDKVMGNTPCALMNTLPPPTSWRMRSYPRFVLKNLTRPVGIQSCPLRDDSPGGIVGPMTLRHTVTTRMNWTTPTLVEICIGLEINGVLIQLPVGDSPSGQDTRRCCSRNNQKYVLGS